MPYNAKVFRILIASPSDVDEERNQISKVIQEWNDLQSYQRKVVLLPLKWETHSSPEYGRRPQDIINEEVVDYCDMAVGVFWTRLGSPTGTHASGTIEEIERVGASGKIVMLYFSKAKIEPDAIDLEQYKNLKEFKKKTYPNGLVESYNDIVDFRDKFTKQLEIKIRTLIAKETDDSVESLDLTAPSFEINLVDPDIDAVINNNSVITINTIEIENFNEIPDFEKEEKDDYRDKDYYRHLITRFQKESDLKKFSFNLNNLGQISIRDIYCDIKILKAPGLELGEKKHSRVLIRRRSDQDNFLYPTINEDHYLLSIQYSALPPQRNVSINEFFACQSLNDNVLKLEVTTYADCFPKPITSNLEYKILRKVKKVNGIDYLKEKGIL